MEKPTPPQGHQPSANEIHELPPSYERDAPGAGTPKSPGSPPLGEQGSLRGGLPPHQDVPPHHSQGVQPQQKQQFNNNNNNYAPQMNMGCVPLQMLQSQSAPVLCPSCGRRNMTVTTPESGGFTHGIAALACFVACLGCIPYCITSLKDVHHKCANCGIPLAHFHRSGRTEVLAYTK
ncbi:LITAF-like zinc ribbon domain-containing protein [Thelonectria olida]|uniref:LITAF-like zinc ribbon domain-containing protein n=1 Tax=Thelonectria olida TaxID=1576542 RepID=A0A9P8VY59_9HYPO|nr:LITAF-like zinc ribbon domain-containing protein [Thelonectria olida]